MSDGSSIEWTDATWQPVLGCTRVSAGCDNCYAMKLVHRGMSESHRGLTKLRPKDASRPGVDWNGTVRLQPEKLADPLRWRKPRRIFVCSLADLFHEQVPFEYIASVFGVMAACPQHTFLVLTKRPERAREFFAWLQAQCHEHRIVDGPDDWWGIGCVLQAHAGEHWPDLPEDEDDGIETGRLARLMDVGDGYEGSPAWPLPNVHLGTSVEDQDTADARIPVLLQCPAALHWISAEPLLDMIVLRDWTPEHATLHVFDPSYTEKTGLRDGPVMLSRGAKLGWVIVGGESGPGARPFDVSWARSIVSRCKEDGVPVFVKQVGAKPMWSDPRDAVLTSDRKGGTMADWPTDLRVREVPT